MRWRKLKDQFAGRLTWALTVFAAALILVIALALLVRAQPLLDIMPLGELLTSSDWHPLRGEFGFLPFILGTLWVTALAMVLSVPPCLLCAIYLAEYAPPRLRDTIKPLIDLLAGIPSVVYGLWGTLVVVPAIRGVITPWVGKHLGFISLLCATRWQMVKGVVLRRSLPGVIAAVVLGFSRAFGETMAVMMVVGNVPQIPRSIFDAAYPLPALIANNYGEMMSIPMYDAALLAAALVLLLVVLVFTLAARIVLLQAVRRVR
jgi:phosphate transport system permease protein